MLKCKLCQSNISETLVSVIYNGRCVYTNNSAIKATDWALEYFKTPCTLSYIYRCTKCNYDEARYERSFTDK